MEREGSVVAYLQGEKIHPSDAFVICILNHERDYHDIKMVLTNFNLMSQCFLRRTAERMNMSVASNIMKQINSKIGGESIRVKLPKFMETSAVMVVGIDVCHAGKNSIVGFVASTNKHCTAFSSDIIIQPKYQEIVKKDLDRCYLKALKEFKRYHQTLPEKIIIFRDGVGEFQRADVVQNEINQLKSVLEGIYNKLSPPKITLIVVNKRINQRMFIESRDSRIENPMPGTVLDSGLVENCEGNNCYDFFLVPQQTTQGCVTPTHFFVTLNESADVTKQMVEDMTFCMSFMYSNWSGSIKVPSLCQYAHKIADYHHNFDKMGFMKQGAGSVSLKNVPAYNPNFLSKPYYL